MKKSAIPLPSREDLQALRDSGLNRDAIARHYKVSLTTVKRWIAALNILKPTKGHTDRRKEPRKRIAVDEGMTLIEKALKILGDRVRECRWRGYLVDGKALRADDMITAAGLAPMTDFPLRRRPEFLDL